MSDENFDFELRRLKFIEACAYYVYIKGITVNELKMTQDLADLITERFRSAKLEWSVGSSRHYTKLLDEGMNEELPDIIGDYVNTPMALRFNFQSLVAKVVRDKELLLGISPKPASKQDTNGNEVWPTTPIMQLPKPSAAAAAAAAPHDFLIGFTVHMKPDAHLDEMIPICARDQHLLYNIFGDKWKSPEIISAYTSVKGQTGFMHNWTSNDNNSIGNGNCHN